MKTTTIAVLTLSSACMLALGSCRGPQGRAGLNGTDGQDGTNASAQPTYIFTDAPERAVAYGNGVLVAVADDRASRSADGIAWTAVASPFSAHSSSAYPLCSVAFGNNVFIAVDANGNCYQGDSSGAAWTLESKNFGGLSENSVCFGAGKFVEAGDNNAFSYSSDGSAWENGSAAGSYSGVRAVTRGGSEFVAVGTDCALYSADGISWTAVSIPGAGQLSGVAYGSGRYVAVGNGTIATSADGGKTWSKLITPTLSAAYLVTVAYSNGYFVAAGNHQAIMTSADGISWSEEGELNTGSSYSDFLGIAGFGSGSVFVIANVTIAT